MIYQRIVGLPRDSRHEVRQKNLWRSDRQLRVMIPVPEEVLSLTDVIPMSSGMKQFGRRSSAAAEGRQLRSDTAQRVSNDI